MTIDLSDWMNVRAAAQKELDNCLITTELLDHQIGYLDKKIKPMEEEALRKKKSESKKNLPAGVM